MTVVVVVADDIAVDDVDGVDDGDNDDDDDGSDGCVTSNDGY